VTAPIPSLTADHAGTTQRSGRGARPGRSARLSDVPRILRRRFRTSVWKVCGYPVLRNVSGDREKRSALLVYLVEPFVLRADDPRFLAHQNLKQCLQIASALGDAGFSVDVADMDDAKFFPERTYDLVLSHRGDLPDPKGMMLDSVRVYLATGKNHKVHNRNVRARYEALAQRRGAVLDPLSLNREDLPFVRQADAIAGFGNGESVATWSDLANVPLYPFNNYGYASTRSTVESKDFAEARSHFLFFASRDQVAKGLDLLLEIFARHPGCHLYVCSAFKKEEAFVDCYQQELFHTPNIHAVGLVPVNGERFYELTRRCAHVIHPSCSDATPGSVVQCMHTGLIPIVTRECGMDLDGIGTVLSDDRLSAIEQAIVEAAAREKGWLEDQARKTRELAREKYSEDVFLRRWREIAHSLALLHKEGTRR
jgi:glycosyltransferase involved in cell wall biosynthesis